LLYSFIISPMHATYPSHLILLNLTSIPNCGKWWAQIQSFWSRFWFSWECKTQHIT
jgi:hypothetical protein